MAPSYPRLPVPVDLDKRADDGFWTPGMREPGFETAALQTLNLAPSLDSPDVSTVLVTVTATLELPASTVTEVVDPSPASPTTSSLADSSSVAPAPIFNPKSSSAAPGKVFLPVSTSEGKVVITTTPAPPPPSTSLAVQEPTSTTPSTLAPVTTSAPAVTTTPSVASIFNPKQTSQVRAVAPSSLAAEPIASSPVTSSSSAALASTSAPTRPSLASTRIAVVAPPTTSAASTAGPATSSSSASPSSLVIFAPSASTSGNLASLSSATLALSSTSLTGSSSSASSPLSSSPVFSTSAESSSISSSSASSNSAVPTADHSSFFAKLGKTPANIALTTIVCAGILAVILGVVAFVVRRCHVRRKKALLNELLGPDDEKRLRSDRDDWEKFADDSPDFGCSGPTPPDVDSPGVEPNEVWRRRTLDGMTGIGLAYPAATYPATSPRRMSRDVFPARPVATLGSTSRPPMRPSNSAQSASLYSATVPPTPFTPGVTPFYLQQQQQLRTAGYPSAIPLSPALSGSTGTSGSRSPTSPSPPRPSPSYFSPRPDREILAHPTATAPGIIRTLPSISGPSGAGTPRLSTPADGLRSGAATPRLTWKESLERVMTSAADLVVGASSARSTPPPAEAGPGPRTMAAREQAQVQDAYTEFPSPLRRPAFQSSTVPNRPKLRPAAHEFSLPLSPRPRLPPSPPSPSIPLPAVAAPSAPFYNLVPTSSLTVGPPSNQHPNHSRSFSATSLGSSTSAGSNDLFVSPSTLAHPEQAVQHVDSLVRAEPVRMVRTPSAGALRPALAVEAVGPTPPRPDRAPGHGGRFEPAPAPTATGTPRALRRQGMVQNPFAAPLDAASEEGQDPYRPVASSSPSPALPSAFTAPPLGRQRSTSLDGDAGSYASADMRRGLSAFSVSSTGGGSSFDGEHADGGEEASLSSSSSDAASRLVSSLMLERRRRSLASIAAARSLPGSRAGSAIGHGGPPRSASVAGHEVASRLREVEVGEAL
ncbi:hypothetical protein JCM8097_000558 [Rhodosporidiobolus ruineniae]